MKRFLILLSVVTSFALPCFAETVTLRGGITFSNDKQEIISFEESQGTDLEINPTGNDYFSENCLYCKSISLAGYNDCAEIYYFNQDNHLESVLYIFDWTEENKDVSDKQFATLDNALSKYGNPIASGSEYIAINESAVDALDFFAARRFNGKFDTSELRSFSQRLVEDSDGYIDIKLIEFHHWVDVSNKALGINMKLHYYPVAISYTYCSAEQVKAISDKATEKQNALNSDL